MIMKDSKTVVISKVIFAVLAFLYTLDYYNHQTGEIFFNNFNLIIHEAGHVVFILFGHFVYMAGGTIMQLAVPAVIGIYFFFTKNRYSACIMLFWLGMSLFNVSAYAGDAITQLIPLLGGDAVTHDWNYLLSTLNMLQYASYIAAMWRGLGFVSIFVGLIGSLYFALNDKADENIIHANRYE